MESEVVKVIEKLLENANEKQLEMILDLFTKLANTFT